MEGVGHDEAVATEYLIASAVGQQASAGAHVADDNGPWGLAADEGGPFGLYPVGHFRSHKACGGLLCLSVLGRDVGRKGDEAHALAPRPPVSVVGVALVGLQKHVDAEASLVVGRRFPVVGEGGGVTGIAFRIADVILDAGVFDGEAGEGLCLAFHHEAVAQLIGHGGAKELDAEGGAFVFLHAEGGVVGTLVEPWGHPDGEDTWHADVGQREGTSEHAEVVAHELERVQLLVVGIKERSHILLVALHADVVVVLLVGDGTELHLLSRAVDAAVGIDANHVLTLWGVAEVVCGGIVELRQVAVGAGRKEEAAPPRLVKLDGDVAVGIGVEGLHVLVFLFHAVPLDGMESRVGDGGSAAGVDGRDASVAALQGEEHGAQACDVEQAARARAFRALHFHDVDADGVGCKGYLLVKPHIGRPFLEGLPDGDGGRAGILVLPGAVLHAEHVLGRVGGTVEMYACALHVARVNLEGLRGARIDVGIGEGECHHGRLLLFDEGSQGLGALFLRIEAKPLAGQCHEEAVGLLSLAEAPQFGQGDIGLDVQAEVAILRGEGTQSLVALHVGEPDIVLGRISHEVELAQEGRLPVAVGAVVVREVAAELLALVGVETSVAQHGVHEGREEVAGIVAAVSSLLEKVFVGLHASLPEDVHVGDGGTQELAAAAEHGRVARGVVVAAAGILHTQLPEHALPDGVLHGTLLKAEIALHALHRNPCAVGTDVFLHAVGGGHGAQQLLSIVFLCGLGLYPPQRLQGRLRQVVLHGGIHLLPELAVALGRGQHGKHQGYEGENRALHIFRFLVFSDDLCRKDSDYSVREKKTIVKNIKNRPLGFLRFVAGANKAKSTPTKQNATRTFVVVVVVFFLFIFSFFL